MRKLIIVLFLFLTTASANSQLPTPSVAQPGQPPQGISAERAPQSNPDQRGTEDRPLFVKPIIPPKSEQESTQDQEDRKEKATADWWMEILTGAIAIIGGIQAVVFWVQASRLKATIKKMDEIATGQTDDMSKSIAQWSRVAEAMEDVSTAMTANVEKLKETVEIARENMVTSKRIADQQERIGGLQTRAYLMVEYLGMVPQNNGAMHRFEPRLRLSGNGLTPAYKVRYRAVSDVLQFPLPDDFGFLLPPATESGGTGLLGPRNTFTISAALPRMYSDLEIAEIKNGSTRRIYIWGIVDYEDAFGVPRYVEFAQSVVWFADGTTTTGFNTKHHNDAN